MKNTNKKRYKLEQFYPGLDRQKFFDLFVNHKAWTKSDFMPGKISIIKPGKDHPLGLGAVRAVDSGRMIIKEDIIGFQSPKYFSYASRNGSMPVNDFVGELFLEEQKGGVLAKYNASFNSKHFGTGWIFKYVFRSVHKSAFRDLEKAYKAYYNI